VRRVTGGAAQQSNFVAREDMFMALETLQIREVGEVREIRKEIAKVTGLSKCMNGELLDFTSGAKGLVAGFNEESVFVFILGNVAEVKLGGPAYSRLKPFLIPVGAGCQGRIVNALAQPVDSRGPISPDAHSPLFREAPGVLDRVPIRRPFETGILSIDGTIPIGKGQRELIIGDRMTGKTTICVDAILNQKDKDVICIYCCIGRSYSSLRQIIQTLKLNGALDHTVVVAGTASACSGEQYLAPYTACTIGEYFMETGRDVFVVYDDLTKHAWAYRELSLLLERPPGRECYPGDIFYLHSQLLERAAQLSPELGGGSLTAFPIVDTLQGDVTGYIPSNLVSMTDGQIYMDSTLFNAGFRPAIDLGLSVSRIGNKVQSHALRQLSAMLRLEYVQYNEMLKMTRFTAGISEEIAEKLRPGEVLTHLLTQEANDPYTHVKEILLLNAHRRKVLEPCDAGLIERFKREFATHVRDNCPEAVAELEEKRDFTPALRRTVDECMAAFLGE